MLLRGRRALIQPAVLFSLTSLALLAGCASPGPPRPPSLQLPRPVNDLTALREGDAVEIRFTVSTRTSDNDLLRAHEVFGSLCRQVDAATACTPVDVAETAAALPVPGGGANRAVIWSDPLPPALREGPPHLLVYRVELRTAAGRSAGSSDAAYAVAGAAPAAVEGLAATGVRAGVELHWTPGADAGEVLLRRSAPGVSGAADARPAAAAEDAAVKAVRKGNAGTVSARLGGREIVQPSKRESGVVWLETHAEGSAAAATIDNTVQEGVAYTYVAQRRVMARLGGRMLELRSALSAPVAVSWRDVYPPEPPRELTGVGFVPRQGAGQTPPSGDAGYAVDLVWTPVLDDRLAGYLVYRQTLGAGDEPEGVRQRLTPEPLPAPGFHDVTAIPGLGYRYSVTAIDPRGNESAAATTEVKPATVP